MDSPHEVVLTPHWPTMLRWHANAMMTHSFDFGARAPIQSFMEMVRYLSIKDPEEMDKIIKEFTEVEMVSENGQ